mgnify:CR=1 FL=1
MSTHTYNSLDDLRQYIKSAIPLKRDIPMDPGSIFIIDANTLLEFGKWEDCGSCEEEAFATLCGQADEAKAKLKSIGLAYNEDASYEVTEHFKDHDEHHVYYQVYQIGCPYSYNLWLVVCGRTYKGKLESRQMLTNVKG